jgi:predicted dehydrogenase
MSTRRDFLANMAATATLSSTTVGARDRSRPRVGIIGLVHDHARLMLPPLTANRSVQFAGIVEPDAQLCAVYAEQFKLAQKYFFPTLDALRATTPIDAVATFTSIPDHRSVVERCATLGIDVMMEKPLALNAPDARTMAMAAQRGDIEVLVNYDTTWYPSVKRAMQFVLEAPHGGSLRKVVVRTGHSGPGPGTSQGFLESLTDPAQGGGVLLDFGCYGIALVTCLMRGVRPMSVFALGQTFQPQRFPRVEDEATIVLRYPQSVAIVEASWNWPHGQKSMDIYTVGGELHQKDPVTLTYRAADRLQPASAEVAIDTDKPADPYAEALMYLAQVVRREQVPSGASSLRTNLVVTEILDAARQSIGSGRSIVLSSEAEVSSESAARL